ncbi:MAG TPA: enoyl-CoA hydratase/isomerase family protein, partial [Xanthobacteraceae bacterium]
MALVEQSSQDAVTAVLVRAGLPSDAVAAWLEEEHPLTGDDRRDGGQASRRWRIGAELLALLSPKQTRSKEQAAAAGVILERERAPRRAFLDRHGEALYRRLTDNFSKFKRVDELVRDAAVAVPGLVPDDKQVDRENALQQQYKDGFEIDQGLFLSRVLSDAACGMHLCHAMLLPRAEAVEQSRHFRERDKLEFEGARVERRGRAALVTMRNPRFLNAEDETTLDGFEIAVDVATIDTETDIAVLRGDSVQHAKYRGQRLFSAGINLTHLYHGKISYLWYIKRDMGVVNKLFRGVAHPQISPDEMTGGTTEKPWIGVVEGFAIGGGCQLLLALDYVLAASDAYMTLPARKEGII